MNPEHIPSINHVNAYLQKRDQAHLCQDVTDCNPWPAEALLLEDLRVIEDEHGSDAEREHIRTLIRAVSWFTYPPIPESALVPFLEETHRSLREWALPKEYSAAWETILASCDAGETGTLLESSCRKMDHLFLFVWKELNRFRKAHNIPWKQLAQNDLPADLQLQKDLVQLIRPVRDLLYFRRHFSGWLEPSATPSSTP